MPCLVVVVLKQKSRHWSTSKLITTADWMEGSELRAVKY